MATTTQTDSTIRTDEQPPNHTGTAIDSRPTTSWTERCSAPLTFDLTSDAATGQFQTDAEPREEPRTLSIRPRNAYPRACQRPPMAEYTTVSIPKDLAERVEETIEGTSFSSTSDLVRFMLRSIVIQHQRSGQLTEAEFQDITEQLQDLGYIE